jgi:hypothetical protein
MSPIYFGKSFESDHFLGPLFTRKCNPHRGRRSAPGYIRAATFQITQRVKRAANMKTNIDVKVIPQPIILHLLTWRFARLRKSCCQRQLQHDPITAPSSQVPKKLTPSKKSKCVSLANLLFLATTHHSSTHHSPGAHSPFLVTQQLVPITPLALTGSVFGPSKKLASHQPTKACEKRLAKKCSRGEPFAPRHDSCCQDRHE